MEVFLDKDSKHTQRDVSPTTRHMNTQFEQENVWKCNKCFLDKRCFQYIAQLGVTIITLLFCMIMIINKHEDDDITIWVSIISTIVGNFMPTMSEYPKSAMEHNVASAQ